MKNAILDCDPMDAPDKKALKILFDTYWSHGRWRDEQDQKTPKEDMLYARKAGIMFSPVSLDHNDVIRRAQAACKGLDRRTVADAFVYSLSTRRLDLRSALGSFAVLNHMPTHKMVRSGGRAGSSCGICGDYDERERQDLNVLSFERHKWGGVRHSTPRYAGFDLGLFRKTDHPKVEKEGLDCLKGILDAITATPMGVSSANLQTYLGKAFKSNKGERDVVVEVLGYCGILGTRDHPGYVKEFVSMADRALPGRRFVFMRYPACWWSRSDGVNQEAVKFWFGHLL